MAKSMQTAHPDDGGSSEHVSNNGH